MSPRSRSARSCCAPSLRAARGALDEYKSKWVERNLDELHAQAVRRRAYRQILADMAASKVSNVAIRKLAYARRKEAGAGALEPFRLALTGGHGASVSPTWAIAKADASELDLVEVIDSLRQAAGISQPASSGSNNGAAGGGNCQASAAYADRCLSALGNIGLTKEDARTVVHRCRVCFIRNNPSDVKGGSRDQEARSLGD